MSGCTNSTYCGCVACLCGCHSLNGRAQHRDCLCNKSTNSGMTENFIISNKYSDLSKCCKTCFGSGNVLQEMIGTDFYKKEVIKCPDCKRNEKKSGWINIYPGRGKRLASEIHQSEEEANRLAEPVRIDCVKVEWEE